MNQDLKTFPLDDDNILLSWNKENDETNYHIVGVNNLFNNEVIASTKANKYILSLDQMKPYIKVFVQYVYQDQTIKKEVVLGKSKYYFVHLKKEIKKGLNIWHIMRFLNSMMILKENMIYTRTPFLMLI